MGVLYVDCFPSLWILKILSLATQTDIEDTHIERGSDTVAHYTIWTVTSLVDKKYINRIVKITGGHAE